MTTSIRYTGTQKQFFEVALTGVQRQWTPGQQQDVSDAHAATLIATATFAPASPSRARAAWQLAGTPSAADITLSGDFFLYTDPTQRYVVNAGGTAYVVESSGGSGAFSGITGQPTDNANLSAALNTKLNLALGWNGTTPALASGTNPITAGFGSNSFVYTGAGTSPALDGVTGVNGDVFIFGQGGSATWGVVPKHDPSAVLTSQVGAASGVASLDSGGKVPVAQLPAAVTGSLNYQGTYNASTNTPAITAGNKGFYWKVSVAGTNLGYTWSVGDDVVDNGTTIDQIDGSGLSATVAANTTAIAQIGKPGAISGATTLSYVTHNGENLVCTSTPALTINAGLGANFGCSIKGAFTTAGTAAVADLRTTTGTAFCCLVSSDTAGTGLTYDLVGTK